MAADDDVGHVPTIWVQDERGEVTEGTTTNVFFVRHGVLHTPALACEALPGITRSDVLRRARRLGMRVREGRYRTADLMRARIVRERLTAERP